ncbi:hypothetical protein T4C_642 [Trichinella pseudospiralis]|uniref:Uncharacterized protein n=1 Tax=Trichinella pseudospiralis TaxID=6337 RepID=A0A0V1HKF5_TRIPS|nr:hypothetical protein T4C_642 [Trichinella pseudospiralis]
MPAEIAKVFLEEIGSGNIWCAAVEENGRCDSQAEYCTFIKKIFPKLLFIKPPARSPGMEKQQIIVDYM